MEHTNQSFSIQEKGKPLQIAIDGPVGSGKGTLAVALAKKLHATHIYTGGMYRALALAVLRSGIDIHNEEQVFEILKNSNIDLRVEDGSPLTRIFLNDEDVTNEIFLPEVSNNTPIVAAFKSVREEMVNRQRVIAHGRKGVIEGRDIATHVSPNADLKIYLTASIEERANRRYKQLRDKSVPITFEEVKQDVLERDRKDSEREHAPLAAASDAVVIDTTHDTIEDTVEKVMDELKKRNLE